MVRISALLLLVACGDSGEPIKGDVAIDYGSNSPDLKVGTVVQDQNDPELMVVQIGTKDVDCDTYLDVLLSFDVPEGTFVYFNVPKAPGAYLDAPVSTMLSSDNNVSINSSQGDVTIDAVEPRVTGSVTFGTTDEDVGMISVAGTFDVFSCL